MKVKDVVLEMHQGINTVADKVEYVEYGIPIIQSKNFTKGYLDLEDVRYLNKEDENKYIEKYSPHKADILLANIGTIGKSYVIKEEQKFFIAWNVFLIKPNREMVLSDFLKYYFDYLASTHYFEGLLTGGTVKFINKAKIGDIALPDFNIDKQTQICNLLCAVEELIIKGEKELRLLDELIKARFVELTERANTIPTRMGDIATYVNGYAFKPEQWEDNGYPIIRIQNLNDANAPYNYYSGDLAEKYLIHNGDVLVSWATHLEAYIWKGREAWLNQHIFKAVFDKMYVDKTYYVYACEEALRQAFRNAHGFKPTMEHIKKSDFDAAIVRLPDIETQKEFADFVNQVDKSKVVVQKSLEKTKLLFDSLMQEYFG